MAFWGDRGRHGQRGAETASLTASGGGRRADTPSCHGGSRKETYGDSADGVRTGEHLNADIARDKDGHTFSLSIGEAF